MTQFTRLLKRKKNLYAARIKLNNKRAWHLLFHVKFDWESKTLLLTLTYILSMILTIFSVDDDTTNSKVKTTLNSSNEQTVLKIRDHFIEWGFNLHSFF